jgi:hypothetical protein
MLWKGGGGSVKMVATKNAMKKRFTALVLAMSLFTGAGLYTQPAAAQPVFITVDLSDVDETLTDPTKAKNPEDFPYGIECGDPNFVYITIHNQGLLAKISKADPTNISLIDQPDEQVVGGQDFYSVERDPNTGNLFINERDTGELWRFIPSQPIATAWTRIPIVEQIADSNPDNGLDDVVYPETYAVRPARIQVNGNEYLFGIPSFGEVVFAGGNIWVALSYSLDFSEADELETGGDKSFAGLVKVNPNTLAVERIPIEGAITPTGLAADSLDPSMIWVTDQPGDKLYRFNTISGTVIQTISDPLIDEPRGIATDASNIYVALNKPAVDNDEDFVPDNNSEIAQINRSTGAVSIIDTGAQLVDIFLLGTFSVFVAEDEIFGNLLVWTDQSQHVGTVNLLTGEKSFDTTSDTNSNHFGCVPFNGQFWFAGQGSVKVGIIPNSKFVVGGIKSANGATGTRKVEDTTPPTIESYYWNPEDPASGNSVTINANILDNAFVQNAMVFYYGPEEDERKAHSVEMEKQNGNWFAGVIPASGVQNPTLTLWVTAIDGGGNSAKSDIKTVNVKQGQPTPQPKSGVSSLPAHVLEAIKLKAKPVYPVEKLEISSKSGNDAVRIYPDEIVIKNVGTVPVNNVRIMLSPEISKSFMLGEHAIKSIMPDESVTITLELNGSPNRDMFGGISGYSGNVMVMAEHHSPITLAVNIASEESMHISDYMAKVAGMAQVRYNKVSLLTSLLNKNSDIKHDYSVTTKDGDSVITSPSGELTIKNLSSRALENVRIYLSGIGQSFLLDRNNIQYLEPNGEITLKLTSLIDTATYSKDINGELLIVPANDNPIQIPVKISGKERENSMNEYQVIIGSDKEGSESKVISTAAEKITIKNGGERTMDSVKISLSSNLERVFTVSENTMQTIEPDAEVNVDLKYNAKDLKTFMLNYNGELIVVSEHHNMQIIPVSIVWEKVESKHFIIYARNGNEQMAKELTDYLEANYQKITSRFGEMKTKTVIYLASTEEELRTIASNSFYSFSNDVIFMCNCNDVKETALEEFVYRILFNNYPNYANKSKFVFDKENWLMDGIAEYIASEMSKSKSASAETIVPSFVWFGNGSPEHYATTHTFFDYLTEKYGDGVINRILYHLGSGMISNHRCLALEDCAVLHAVYDANGLDMDNKRHSLNFQSVVQEWEEYIVKHYSVSATDETKKETHN